MKEKSNKKDNLSTQIEGGEVTKGAVKGSSSVETPSSVKKAAQSKETEDTVSKIAIALNVGKTHGRTPSRKPDERDKVTDIEEEFTFSGNADTAKFAEFGMALYHYDIKAGRRRLSEIKATTIRSFLQFTGGKDVLLKNITPDLITRYENYLQKDRGLTKNTSSFYLRNTRAIYNQAIKHLGIKDLHPFKEVYTGVAKTVKRAVSMDTIKKIKALDLSKEPGLCFARDMFMLSFLFRGMSFVDMAFLKVTDLQDGVLNYKRKKTGQSLSIKWEQPMQRILNRWPNETRPEYLLPIIVKTGVDDVRQYRTELFKVNKSLKTIGERISSEVPLTLYVARHSWATIAKDKGVPVHIISEGMGHTSESMTMVYLGSIGQGQIDSANRKIMNSL